VLTITAAATDPREVTADALVLPVFKGGIEGPGTELVLRQLGLDTLPVTPGFRGDVGQTLLLAAPGLAAGGVLLVGLGRMDAADPEQLRRAAGTAAVAVRHLPRVATTLAQVHATPAAVEAVAEGFQLGGSRSAVRRDSSERVAGVPDRPHRLREVVILGPSAQLGQAREALARAQVTSRAVLAARDLVDTPPDRKRPAELAERLVALCAGCCDGVVYDEAWLAAEGFGGILAVGAGSSAPPRLVRLTYRPADPVGSVVLVGKGITFDSGGLSLKRGTAMAEMKADMAGAAAVAAAMSVLGDLDVRLEVTALLPLAENMPGGAASRPGDVVTMHGGRTVEVLDTDAEGRMVLADALAHAVGTSPDAIVDLATLTGSAVTAVGRYAAVMMGNDPQLLDTLELAAALAGEDLVQIPLWPRLERWLDSPVAELNNTGDGPSGGHITAGLFLQRFVGDVPWAHLDIAGPAFLPADLAEGYLPAGATGFGVRTLLAWLERRAA